MQQDTQSGVCLIVGLSGVGKSTMISSASSMEDFRIVSASALLKEAKQRLEGLPLTSEDLRAGKVLDNQQILLQAFHKLREEESRPVIVDAHNIIDTENGVIDIPEEVLSGFNPRVIVLIFDDPEKIQERRKSDIARERPYRTALELNNQQERAISRARSLADDLGIDFVIIRLGDNEMLRETLAPLR